MFGSSEAKGESLPLVDVTRTRNRLPVAVPVCGGGATRRRTNVMLISICMVYPNGTVCRGKCRLWGCGVVGLMVAVSPAAADDLQLAIEGGRVTLVADGARLADVLVAWEQAGQMRFVGTEALRGESVTLHMVDVEEAEALRVLLRPAAGYIAARRAAGSGGASRYDRVKVLATSPSPLPAPRAETPAAGVPLPASAQDSAVPRDHLQALLDQAAGAATRTDAAGSDAGSSAGDIARPAPLTAVPGIAGAPTRPPRWQRRPRGPSGDDPFGGAPHPPAR